MPGERFHVRLVPEEGGAADRVVVEVGMEGFNVLSSDGQRTLRKYPLTTISRWSMRGSSLILFTRSPVDVEDCTMTLQGDEHTIRSVLDTLTSCCMQMAEILQSKQGSDSLGANSLQALLRKSKKAESLPTADQVEFWKSPEKTGWMYSQGEHIKTWRKRWFILKQGFLFRFSSEDVGSSAKPRGIVDLSQVTDVSDGTSTTGRSNSIKLSTATGSRCYLTDSETSQVEWISALEGSVARIVKIIAGVDDSDGSSSHVDPARSLAEQLRHSYSEAAASGGGGGRSNGYMQEHNVYHNDYKPRYTENAPSSSRQQQMIDIVNYDGGFASAPHVNTTSTLNNNNNINNDGYVSIDYGAVAGAHHASIESSGQHAAPAEHFGVYGQIYTPTPASAPPQNMHSSMYDIQQQQAQPNQYQAPLSLQQQYASHAAAEGGTSTGGVYTPGSNVSTLMDAVIAPQQPPAQQQSTSPWQVHYTGDGRPYYYDSTTGITTWNAPNQ